MHTVSQTNRLNLRQYPFRRIPMFHSNPTKQLNKIQYRDTLQNFAFDLSFSFNQTDYQIKNRVFLIFTFHSRKPSHHHFRLPSRPLHAPPFKLTCW